MYLRAYYNQPFKVKYVCIGIVPYQMEPTCLGEKIGRRNNIDSTSSKPTKTKSDVSLNKPFSDRAQSIWRTLAKTLDKCDQGIHLAENCHGKNAKVSMPNREAWA